jgi:hypothetical protein
VPDSCETDDLDGNGVPDDCDLAARLDADCNHNGVPDLAELAPRPRFPSHEVEHASGHVEAVADIDGDGDNDLVLSHGPRILWNRGDGVFPRVTALKGGGDGALADLDRDGDLDIISLAGRLKCTFHAERTLLVSHLNDGRGAMGKLAVERMPEDSLRSRALIAGDFDSDEIPDAALIAENYVWLVRGRGDGTFASRREVPLWVGEGESHIAAADLDRDGDLDLLTNGGRVAINDGASFMRGGSFSASGDGLAVADLDGDGDADVATGGQLARNRGDGTFEAGQTFDPAGTGVAARDLDRDGDADILLASSRSIGVLLNDGLGTFTPAGRYASTHFAYRVEAADLTGDSRLDLIVSPGLVVHEDLGDGTFLSRIAVEEQRPSKSLRAADVDGDLDLDLMKLQFQGIVILRNDGAGRLVVEPVIAVGWAAFLEVADMDGDGDPDPILAYAGEESTEISILRNDRGTGFESGPSLLLESQAVAIAVERSRGHRPSEIAVLTPSDVRILDVDEDLGLVELSAFHREDASTSLLLDDIDGDGVGDLLVGGRLRLNRGGGSFSETRVVLAGPVTSAATLDFDRDGRMDLALAIGPPSESGRVVLRLAAGDGTFRDGGGIDLEPVMDLHAADVDLDGDPDIAARSLRSIHVLLSDGGGIEPWGRLDADDSANSLVAGDLDGDGYPDFAVAGLRGVSVYPNKTIPPSGRDADGGGILDECAARFRRGDWTEDGRLDLADAVAILDHLFLGAPRNGCLEAGDADDNGFLGLADPIRILRHLFQGLPAPPEPSICGRDPTPDTLGCAGFAACP